MAFKIKIKDKQDYHVNCMYVNSSNLASIIINRLAHTQIFWGHLLSYRFCSSSKNSGLHYHNLVKFSSLVLVLEVKLEINVAEKVRVRSKTSHLAVNDKTIISDAVHHTRSLSEPWS